MVRCANDNYFPLHCMYDRVYLCEIYFLLGFCLFGCWTLLIRFFSGWFLNVGVFALCAGVKFCRVTIGLVLDVMIMANRGWGFYYL